MPNMAELLETLTEKGAWLFDPQCDNQPLGFVTKNKGVDDRNPYLVRWYYDSETETPTHATYKLYDLIKYLQPSYAPYLAARPIQWIPVYQDFVKERYPKIFKNHTARDQQALRLETTLKKIHNSTNPTPFNRPKQEQIRYHFEVTYSVDSWDSGHTTNLAHDTLKLLTEDPNKALTIAIKHFKAPTRTPAIIANTSELTARWYSDDACEELGSEITITIKYAS